VIDAQGSITPTSRPSAGLALAELAEEAFRYAAASKSPATIRAYRSDWADFTGWCACRSLTALPASAETIVLYVTDLAGVAKVATIARRVAAISQAHQAAGHESPTKTARVRTTLAGIRRTLGTVQQAKTPVLTADLRDMLDTLEGDRLIDVRDRALLLLGFAGAFRRSELVALDVGDVTDGADGLTILIRRSKTDQEGAGRKVGIPYGSNPATCPVRAYRAWLSASGISTGPVFRPIDRHSRVADGRLSAKTVAAVVKRTMARGGADPAPYAGHSLRSGLATSAAQAGASERSIMAQTGHRSLPMVRRYIRDGSLFRENAAAVVGL
jgi:integrase